MDSSSASSAPLSLRNSSSFKKSETMTDEEAHRTWNSLKDGIFHIYNHNAGNLSFEELYRNAYSLVLHKYGDLLYNGVMECVTEYVLKVTMELQNSVDDDILYVLQDKWDEHKTALKMIRDILMYMDRNYVVANNKVGVYTMGMNIFRKLVICSDNVGRRIISNILGIIQHDRIGNLIDKQLLRNIMALLYELDTKGNFCKEYFEVHFFEEAELFYIKESAHYLATASVPEFLIQAESRINDEVARAEYIVDAAFGMKMRKLMLRVWIMSHYMSLMQNKFSGCNAMFEKNQILDMKRFYCLLRQVPEGLSSLLQEMRNFICNEGFEIIEHLQDNNRAIEAIEKILLLKSKFENFVTSAFFGDPDFRRSLKSSFESFINRDTRVTEYLSVYMDKSLRKLYKESNDESLTLLINNFMAIFGLLTDKDVFENYYKKAMARRLLTYRFKLMDYETLLINRLKDECGHAYTAKLNGMLKDVSLSDDLMKAYNSQAHESKVELCVSIFTKGSWPAESEINCILPIDVITECERFEKFYLSKYSGRRLFWHLEEGSSEVRAWFPKGTRDILCTTFQMCILDVFNSYRRVTIKMLFDITKIPIDELQRHIINLFSCKKCQILRKISDNKSEKLNDDDEFEPNDDFESETMQIQVPLLTTESQGSSSFMKNDYFHGILPIQIEQDRYYIVEAAIIKVMKMKKWCTHEELSLKVEHLLKNKFIPCSMVINQCIEKLISRDYLERDLSDKSTRRYKYLA